MKNKMNNKMKELELNLIKDGFDEVVSDNGYIKCVRKSNGYLKMIQSVGGAVAIATYGDKIVLVKSKRADYGEVYEVPRGYAEKEDSSFVDTAKRELHEETGFYNIKSAKEIVSIHADTGVLIDNIVLVRIELSDLSRDKNIDVEEGILDTELVTKDQFINMIKESKIIDSVSLSSLNFV